MDLNNSLRYLLLTKLNVQLQGMKCPKGHPLTARQGGVRMFLGRENYPTCDITESLLVLEGM